MSISGAGPLETTAWVLQNRGVWYDNPNADADNTQEVNNLADIGPSHGRQWEIRAVDYKFVLEASDAIVKATNNAWTNGIFTVWSLGTDDLPDGIDLTGNTGADPTGSQTLADIVERDQQSADGNEQLVISGGSGRHYGTDSTNGVSGGQRIIDQGRVTVPDGEVFPVDFRQELQYNLNWTVSAGWADADDAQLHNLAIFNIWYQDRAAPGF